MRSLSPPLAIAVSAVVILLLLASSISPSAAADPPTLKVGVGSIATTLDPHLSTGALSILAYANIFDTLTVIEFPGGVAQLKPALAASWKLVNPTTWEFQLRPDARFSNGELVTAETVKFSIDRVLDPATKSPVKGRIITVESVSVPDSRTVRIVTKAPDPILPKRLAVVFIIPQKYFQQVGDKQFATKPIGSGAFCVDSFQQLQQLTLSACGRGTGTGARVKSVQMVQIPDDASRVASLRSGGVHAIQNVPIDQTGLLKQEGLQVKHAVAGRTMMVMLRGQVESPLKHRLVRQALSHAVDSNTIYNSFIKGFGALANGQPIGPDGFGHNPEIRPYAFDPGKAKELLAKAGFANGFTITMSATSGAFVADKDTTQAVQGYLAAVGVTLKEVTVEYGEFLRRTDTGNHEPMFLASYNYFPVMDGDFVLQWFWSKHPVKLGIYPEFDRAFEASRAEMDPSKREQLLRQASRILSDEAAAIYLFRPPDIWAMARGVSGVDPQPDLLVYFDRVSVAR